MERITLFRYDYYFLSNFYPCDVTIDGLRYHSAEAAFQAMKCRKREDRYYFTKLTAGEARKHGRKIALRNDWEKVKIDIMFTIILKKFEENHYLQTKLLQTKDAELIEVNNWNDRFWGVDDGNHIGLNMLGKILMLVRELYS